MKTHEETWEAFGDILAVPDGDVPFRLNDHKPTNVARARLAAQAPAMAQKLLSILQDDDPYWAGRPKGTVEHQIAQILREAGVLP